MVGALLGCGGNTGLFDNGGGSGVGDNYADQLRLSHWASRPVRVAFSTSGTYTSQRRDIAIQAFNRWVDPTGGTVRFTIVPESEKKDIIVRFMPSADPEQESVAGVTTLSVQGDEILDARIDIGTNLSSGDFYKTCIHEFGHAYGLTGGHSDRRTDIMYPFLTNEADDVSARDANTMELAYRDARTRSNKDLPIIIYRISIGGPDGCIFEVKHIDDITPERR